MQRRDWFKTLLGGLCGLFIKPQTSSNEYFRHYDTSFWHSCCIGKPLKEYSCHLIVMNPNELPIILDPPTSIEEYCI